MKKLILITLLSLLCLPIVLVAQGVPLTTVGVSQKDGLVHLGTPTILKTAQVYIFCNRTKEPLWLVRVNFHNPGVQAGWDSYLPAYKCSALMLNKVDFTMACRDDDTKILQTVNCQHYIDAYRLAKTHQTLAKINIGNYWLTEGVYQDVLADKLAARGVQL